MGVILGIGWGIGGTGMGVFMSLGRYSQYILILNRPMQRRIIYKQQAKCNFCCNWFQVFSEIKFGLNICETCIFKALHTSCFKLPTPEGHLYQVYLAKRHISMDGREQGRLMEMVDEYMHEEIKGVIAKWGQVEAVLVGSSVEGERVGLEQLLAEDRRRGEEAREVLLGRIRGDGMPEVKGEVLGPSKTEGESKMGQTPLKERAVNATIYLNKSHKSSSKNLTNFSSSKKPSNDPQHKPVQPFATEPDQLNSTLKKVSSSRRLHSKQNLQNRQFLQKMLSIKTSITNSLQQRQSPALKTQPITIMKQRIYQAIQNTNCINRCIELVSYQGLHGIDMRCYLQNLCWQGVQVVKFVRVGLTDEQLRVVLEFIRDKGVETLVLTGNSLTEESCKTLGACQVGSLKNVYMGRNQILGLKAKNQLRELKTRYNFYL